MTPPPTACHPANRSRPAARLGLGALAVLLLLPLLACLSDPAAAISIVGPDTLTLPQYCTSNSQTYTIVDGGPNAHFDYYVGNANMWTTNPSGPTTALTGRPDFPATTWTLTARDDTGAVFTKNINYVPVATPYFFPGVTGPGIQCKGYYAYDLGQSYTYTIIVSADGYNEAHPVPVTYTEDKSIWVNGYGPTIMTLLSIPRDVYSTTSYLASAGPYDTTQAWDPTHPWAGVTASYDAIYPYPTPDRVLADGGTTWNADYVGNSFGVWPRGIDYRSDFANTDFGMVQQLVEGYGLGDIPVACQNTQRGVFIGPYGYCVFPLDYDRACHHYDPSEPVVTSSCVGTTSAMYGMADVPAPWPNFSLSAAWHPSAQQTSPGSGYSGTTVTKVFAAPTDAQLSLIDRLFKSQGIDLSTFPAVPNKAVDAQYVNGSAIAGTGSTQVLWQLDGRRTFFCDTAAWQSSRLLSSAPYLVNGIYCDYTTQNQYPPPAASIGDPYATNGLPPIGGAGGGTTGGGTVGGGTGGGTVGCAVGAAPV